VLQTEICGWLRSTVVVRRHFPVLRLTCSWRVTTHVVNRPLQVNQLRPTQPFILSGSINE